PRHRRYLRVDTEGERAFQAFLAVADMPRCFSFPGGSGEWLLHVDELPFPVDWCLRIRTVPNSEAQAKAKRQARQLVGQAEEYEGEPSGAQQTLADAMEG